MEMVSYSCSAASPAAFWSNISKKHFAVEIFSFHFCNKYRPPRKYFTGVCKKSVQIPLEVSLRPGFKYKTLNSILCWRKFRVESFKAARIYLSAMACVAVRQPTPWEYTPTPETIRFLSTCPPPCLHSPCHHSPEIVLILCRNPRTREQKIWVAAFVLERSKEICLTWPDGPTQNISVGNAANGSH